MQNGRRYGGKEGGTGVNSVLGFYSVNYFLDGITLITKDEASGSSVTDEEAKKVLISLSSDVSVIAVDIIVLMPILT